MLTTRPAFSDSLAASDDRFLKLQDLANYSALSVRTLQRAIADPVHPLPASRYGRVWLVRRSDYLTWLAERQRGLQRALAELQTDDLSEARRTALALRGYAVHDRRGHR